MSKGESAIHHGIGMLVVLTFLVFAAGLVRLLYAIVFGPCRGGI